MPILASSLIFAYLHKDNPNINIMAYINIFLIGIIWGYYFIKTNDLYMPIGMHFAWNFIQGPIMGFNVSGINFLGLAKSQIVNEGILVGNAFGPESSILITILLVILIAFMKKMINTKDSVV